MHIDHFKQLYKQVIDLEKTGLKFDVQIIDNIGYWQKGTKDAKFNPIHAEVSSLKQLSLIAENKAGADAVGTNSVVLKLKFKPVNCIESVDTIVKSFKTDVTNRQKYNTLKFYSDHVLKWNYGHYNNMLINIIKEAPSEEVEDGITYRYIGNGQNCIKCVPHTHPLYNYLDKGYFFLILQNGRMVITNELTIDTYLSFLILFINNALAVKNLQHEHYLASGNAKLTRIKLEKELTGSAKANYDTIKTTILKDYEKTVNASLLTKLVNKEIKSADYNGVKLTLDKASYETISLQADDLLQVLSSHVIFDDFTDIYSMIRGYINYNISLVESHNFTTTGEGTPEQSYERSATINGIKVIVERKSNNTRRYVNGIAINKDEVDPVMQRASCFNNQETFDKFVRSVHKMSLKYHDALANGIAMKIYKGLTANEYRSAKCDPAAPRIKFKKVDDEFHLIVNDQKTVPIRFGYIITEAAKLNTRINNVSYCKDSGKIDAYGNRQYSYHYKNAEWGCTELAKVLVRACTIEKPVTRKKNKATGLYDITYETVTHLTEEEANFVTKLAEEFHTKALEKSKIFLETAVKATGAKLETIAGAPHYVVQGTLRKYAINKETNQVFNAEDITKLKHICIVEANHQVTAGNNDLLAARLYALKNDSVMTKDIGTLNRG